MSSFIFGRYLPLNSVVHRLDPRAKLMLSFCYIILVFLANNLLSYAILIAFTIGAILASKISLGFFLKGIRPLLWLIVFTVVLQLLFSPAGGQTYFHWAFINITQFGLVNAGFIFIRFLLIIMFSTLLTLSTQPLDIATGLASLMKPLRWVHVPCVYRLAATTVSRASPSVCRLCWLLPALLAGSMRRSIFLYFDFFALTRLTTRPYGQSQR